MHTTSQPLLPIPSINHTTCSLTTTKSFKKCTHPDSIQSSSLISPLSQYEETSSTASDSIDFDFDFDDVTNQLSYSSFPQRLDDWSDLQAAVNALPPDPQPPDPPSFSVSREIEDEWLASSNEHNQWATNFSTDSSGINDIAVQLNDLIDEFVSKVHHKTKPIHR